MARAGALIAFVCNTLWLVPLFANLAEKRNSQKCFRRGHRQARAGLCHVVPQYPPWWRQPSHIGKHHHPNWLPGSSACCPRIVYGKGEEHCGHPFIRGVASDAVTAAGNLPASYGKSALYFFFRDMLPLMPCVLAEMDSVSSFKVMGTCTCPISLGDCSMPEKMPPVSLRTMARFCPSVVY